MFSGLDNSHVFQMHLSLHSRYEGLAMYLFVFCGYSYPLFIQPKCHFVVLWYSLLVLLLCSGTGGAFCFKQCYAHHAVHLDSDYCGAFKWLCGNRWVIQRACSKKRNYTSLHFGQLFMTVPYLLCEPRAPHVIVGCANEFCSNCTASCA